MADARRLDRHAAWVVGPAWQACFKSAQASARPAV